jgi:hypothetical protein
MRRLGSTVCRDCEADRLNQGARATAGGTSARAATAGTSAAGRSPGESGAVDVEHDLAREVAAAIDRVLGRA